MEIEAGRGSYGVSRERGAAVSYTEVERAALQVLAEGSRPSIKKIQTRLGRGSPQTILTCLRRFWRDLGTRAQGDPAALTRLPTEIGEAVDTIWQRALALAAQSAKDTENAAREHLEHLRLGNEVREQSLASREKEYETQARERERALADSRSHLLSTLRMLEADREALKARDRRISDLEAQVEDYRQQVVDLVTRAVARNRAAAEKVRQKPKSAEGETRSAGRAKRIVRRRNLKGSRPSHKRHR
jgi:hypothetical protein